MHNHLENPKHYENMVTLLMLYNSSIIRDPATARHIINVCIRGALEHGDTSTGCCAAYRTSDGKVRLFLEPLIEPSF
jgi:hypothetical protein